MRPLTQWPIVAIPIAKRLPVGGMLVPSGRGIGRVKVPAMTPVTAVQLPEPKRIGCTLIVMSGGVDEERLQVLDVLVDSSGLMAVGPGDDDVLGVALLQPVPFLVAEDVEVEHV